MTNIQIEKLESNYINNINDEIDKELENKLGLNLSK